MYLVPLNVTTLFRLSRLLSPITTTFVFLFVPAVIVQPYSDKDNGMWGSLLCNVLISRSELLGRGATLFLCTLKFLRWLVLRYAPGLFVTHGQHNKCKPIFFSEVRSHPPECPARSSGNQAAPLP